MGTDCRSPVLCGERWLSQEGLIKQGYFSTPTCMGAQAPGTWILQDKARIQMGSCCPKMVG